MSESWRLNQVTLIGLWRSQMLKSCHCLASSSVSCSAVRRKRNVNLSLIQNKPQLMQWRAETFFFYILFNIIFNSTVKVLKHVSVVLG